MSRFVKPSAMRDSVDKVDFKNSKNQKDDKDLIIGDQAQSYIAESEKHGLREVKVEQFYADVKLYFTAVTTYFVDKLPIKEPVLKHAEVLDVKPQQTAKLSDLTFFLDKFPVLIPKDCKQTSSRNSLQCINTQISQVAYLIEWIKLGLK